MSGFGRPLMGKRKPAANPSSGAASAAAATVPAAPSSPKPMPTPPPPVVQPEPPSQTPAGAAKKRPAAKSKPEPAPDAMEVESSSTITPPPIHLTKPPKGSTVNRKKRERYNTPAEEDKEDTMEVVASEAIKSIDLGGAVTNPVNEALKSRESSDIELLPPEAKRAKREESIEPMEVEVEAAAAAAKVPARRDFFSADTTLADFDFSFAHGDYDEYMEGWRRVLRVIVPEEGYTRLAVALLKWSREYLSVRLDQFIDDYLQDRYDTKYKRHPLDDIAEAAKESCVALAEIWPRIFPDIPLDSIEERKIDYDEYSMDPEKAQPQFLEKLMSCSSDAVLREKRLTATQLTIFGELIPDSTSKTSPDPTKLDPPLEVDLAFEVTLEEQLGAVRQGEQVPPLEAREESANDDERRIVKDVYTEDEWNRILVVARLLKAQIQALFLSAVELMRPLVIEIDAQMQRESKDRFKQTLARWCGDVKSSLPCAELIIRYLTQNFNSKLTSIDIYSWDEVGDGQEEPALTLAQLFSVGGSRVHTYEPYSLILVPSDEYQEEKRNPFMAERDFEGEEEEEREIVVFVDGDDENTTIKKSTERRERFTIDHHLVFPYAASLAKILNADEGISDYCSAFTRTVAGRKAFIDPATNFFLFNIRTTAVEGGDDGDSALKEKEEAEAQEQALAKRLSSRDWPAALGQALDEIVTGGAKDPVDGLAAVGIYKGAVVASRYALANPNKLAEVTLDLSRVVPWLQVNKVRPSVQASAGRVEIDELQILRLRRGQPVTFIRHFKHSTAVGGQPYYISLLVPVNRPTMKAIVETMGVENTSQRIDRALGAVGGGVVAPVFGMTTRRANDIVRTMFGRRDSLRKCKEIAQLFLANRMHFYRGRDRVYSKYMFIGTANALPVNGIEPDLQEWLLKVGREASLRERAEQTAKPLIVVGNFDPSEEMTALPNDAEWNLRTLQAANVDRAIVEGADDSDKEEEDEDEYESGDEGVKEGGLEGATPSLTRLVENRSSPFSLRQSSFVDMTNNIHLPVLSTNPEIPSPVSAVYIIQTIDFVNAFKSGKDHGEEIYDIDGFEGARLEYAQLQKDTMAAKRTLEFSITRRNNSVIPIEMAAASLTRPPGTPAPTYKELRVTAWSRRFMGVLELAYFLDEFRPESAIGRKIASLEARDEALRKRIDAKNKRFHRLIETLGKLRRVILDLSGSLRVTYNAVSRRSRSLFGSPRAKMTDTELRTASANGLELYKPGTEPKAGTKKRFVPKSIEQTTGAVFAIIRFAEIELKNALDEGRVIRHLIERLQLGIVVPEGANLIREVETFQLLGQILAYGLVGTNNRLGNYIPCLEVISSELKTYVFPQGQSSAEIGGYAKWQIGWDKLWLLVDLNGENRNVKTAQADVCLNDYDKFSTEFVEIIESRVYYERLKPLRSEKDNPTVKQAITRAWLQRLFPASTSFANLIRTLITELGTLAGSLEQALAVGGEALAGQYELATGKLADYALSIDRNSILFGILVPSAFTNEELQELTTGFQSTASLQPCETLGKAYSRFLLAWDRLRRAIGQFPALEVHTAEQVLDLTFNFGERIEEAPGVAASLKKPVERPNPDAGPARVRFLKERKVKGTYQFNQEEYVKGRHEEEGGLEEGEEEERSHDSADESRSESGSYYEEEEEQAEIVRSLEKERAKKESREAERRKLLTELEQKRLASEELATRQAKKRAEKRAAAAAAAMKEDE